MILYEMTCGWQVDKEQYLRLLANLFCNYSSTQKLINSQTKN